MFYMRTLAGIREVIADDDHARVKDAIDQAHGLDHGGVTLVAYEQAQKYVGFPCNKAQEFIVSCGACQRYQSLKRSEPITCISAKCQREP